MEPQLGTKEYSQKLLEQAKGLGVSGTGVDALSGAITSDTLSGNESPITLPNITPSTISGRIDGQSTSLLEFDALEQKAAQKVEEDRVKLQESQTKSASFLEQLGIKKKEVTGQVEEEFG